MPSIINSDDGVVSGSSGLKTTGGNDGILSIQNNGTTNVTVTAAGNVGIGTSSPGARLQVTDGNFSQLYLNSTTTVCGVRFGNSGSTNGYIYYDNGANLTFQTNGAERARIDSSGNLTVGATSMPEAARVGISSTSASAVPLVVQQTAAGSTTQNSVIFYRNSTTTGTIQVTGTTTAYNTSSDYRLKENVQPMTGALDKVAALKPCTYTWKLDGSPGEGFIAHELAEVVPQAVGGEKDAVDTEGNIKPQGIDTSFLVATLTAAIQELKAELDATKAEVALLKGAA